MSNGREAAPWVSLALAVLALLGVAVNSVLHYVHMQDAAEARSNIRSQIESMKHDLDLLKGQEQKRLADDEKRLRLEKTVR